MRLRPSMRCLPFGLAIVLAACGAIPPTPPASSTPPIVSAVPQPPESPPPGAAGKLSPGMVGQVSPVPAFIGLGEHFQIEIRAMDMQRHHVRLVWGSGTHEAEGELIHRGPPGPGHAGRIALDGHLVTDAGSRTLRVEIRSEACVDDADAPHRQAISVTLEGSAPMQGCGDLAVY